MTDGLQYLLLQVRNDDDPMRSQEQATFVEALGCESSQLASWNLLDGGPERDLLDVSDIVLVGGSGHYSAASDGVWLDRALASLQQIYELRKPMFASCWGFQALARALGGKTITDLDRAELGTPLVQVTDDGQRDPVFAPAGKSFPAFQGHQDRVAELPPDAIHLACSSTAPYQAFTFADRPIYATQFHPELTRHRFLERIRNYPEYVERITGQTFGEFEAGVGTAEKSQGLLSRFIDLIKSQK